MRTENHYFDVYPKIIHSGREETITIRPLFDHVRFDEGLTYPVSIYPMEGAYADSSAPVQLELLPVGGELHINALFGNPLPGGPAEQEYQIIVTIPSNQKKLRTLDFRVYAVEDDLFNRLPYKGDFHMHTFRSDGVESPAYVAASCRRIGLDFMAITDHKQYAPSLEAIQAFEGLPVDLRIYPGEEIHPPENRVHMLNFGGRHSINERFGLPEYPEGVAAIEAKLEGLPEGSLRRQYASCLWTYNQIRQAGGLAIFCHPYWSYEHRYNVPEVLVTRHFIDQPFDAYELIGGFYPHEFESNLLQVARYMEENLRGKRIPIVGVSDSHGVERGALFGWYYSIVFSPSAELNDIIAGVKDCQAVAVDSLPGEVTRAHGPFRLVKYAHFLLREVLPLHDALCAEEGRLMLAYVAGDTAAVEQLRLRQGQTARLYRRLWSSQ